MLDVACVLLCWNTAASMVGRMLGKGPQTRYLMLDVKSKIAQSRHEDQCDVGLRTQA